MVQQFDLTFIWCLMSLCSPKQSKMTTSEMPNSLESENYTIQRPVLGFPKALLVETLKLSRGKAISHLWKSKYHSLYHKKVYITCTYLQCIESIFYMSVYFALFCEMSWSLMFYMMKQKSYFLLQCVYEISLKSFWKNFL